MLIVRIKQSVAYTTAAQYTYLCIIRSVQQYLVPSLLIVTSVYSLELVEKNITLILLYRVVHRSMSPQDT